MEAVCPIVDQGLFWGESLSIVPTGKMEASFTDGAFYTSLLGGSETLGSLGGLFLGVQVGRSHRHDRRHFHGHVGFEYSCCGSSPGGSCPERELGCGCLVHHCLPAHDNRPSSRNWKNRGPAWPGAVVQSRLRRLHNRLASRRSLLDG